MKQPINYSKGKKDDDNLGKELESNANKSRSFSAQLGNIQLNIFKSVIPCPMVGGVGWVFSSRKFHKTC